MIASTNFIPAAVPKNTRKECRMAASLYLSDDLTTASNRDGEYARCWIIEGRRLIKCLWSSLYSDSVNETRKALRMTGWVWESPGEADDEDAIVPNLESGSVVVDVDGGLRFLDHLRHANLLLMERRRGSSDKRRCKRVLSTLEPRPRARGLGGVLDEIRGI